jgi:cell division protein FtsB
MTTTARPPAPGRAAPGAGIARSPRLLTGRPALLALALGIVVLTLFLPLRQWFAQRAQLSALAAQTSALQANLAKLQQAEQRWSDPAYVAAQARARLHFVLPGEVGYVVIGLPNSNTTDPASAPTAAPAAGPWYERLWASVQAADSSAKN